jgi:hypothetical protein
MCCFCWINCSRLNCFNNHNRHSTLTSTTTTTTPITTTTTTTKMTSTSTTTTTITTEELSVLDFNWGQKAYLTIKQQQALQELQLACMNEKLLDENTDENGNEQRLLRFLRDRRFDVKSSLDRIRKDTTWRRTFPTPDIRDFPELLKWHENGAFYLAGQDKYGRPLIVLKLAKLYPNKIDSVDSIIGFLKAYTDAILELAQLHGWSEVSAIGDMENWSIRDNFALSMVASLNEFSTLHYPETSGLVFLVNLPWTFNMAISMVRPFIDERQMSRVINIWNKNELTKIHEHVDVNILEARYGGTKPDGYYPLPDDIVSKLLHKTKQNNGTNDEDEIAAAAAANQARKELEAASSFLWFRAATPALRSFSLCILFFILSVFVLSRENPSVLVSVGGASLLGISGAFLWTAIYGMKEASFIASVVKGSNTDSKKRSHKSSGGGGKRTGIPLSCTITESRLGGGGKYVEYRLDLIPVNNNNNNNKNIELPSSWTVWRRYSQFHRLATTSNLGKKCKTYFPPKTYRTHLESEFINERREALKLYMDSFLQLYNENLHVRNDEIVLQFLQLL